MDSIKSSKEAATLLYPCFNGIDHEEVWILIVKGKNPVTSKRIGMGNQESVPIDKKGIIKEVLLTGGDGIVLSHNHSSSNPRPINGRY